MAYQLAAADHDARNWYQLQDLVHAEAEVKYADHQFKTAALKKHLALSELEDGYKEKNGAKVATLQRALQGAELKCPS